MLPWLLWSVGLAVLSGCHKMPRDNPLDPALTPAVEIVAAEVDTTEGRVQLAWTAYAGEQPFAYYLVLRREQKLVQVDTLARIDDPRTVVFEDTTIAPLVRYVYWVAVFNQHGFFQESPEYPIAAFTVGTPPLLSPQTDDVLGTITLRWRAYTGPAFERYEIWRRSFAGEQQLATKTDIADTAWIDTGAVPRTEYFYWITTVAAGLKLDSPAQEAAYDLPAIELLQAELSHYSAAATLSWTPYQGPGFVGYEVRRRSGRLAEETVRVLDSGERTGYIDSLLNGNTEYEYRIAVRTRWPGIVVESNARGGAFYRLVENRQLAHRNNFAVHALGLALDEEDRLYVGSVQVLTTTAGTLGKGLRVQFPDGTLRYYFQAYMPHSLSGIHVAVEAGTVYATMRTADHRLLVGAINAAKDEEWFFIEDLGDIFPVGIFVDPDGKPTVIDSDGMLYRFTGRGQLEEIDDGLHRSLNTDQAFPLGHLFWKRAAPGNEDDLLFIVAPDRPENHLIGRLKTGNFIGGRSIVFDDGVGLGNGETLDPLVIGYDRRHNRVVVLEQRGRLQVMRAERDIESHYLTQWGTFGEAPGEFAPVPKTTGALVVDAQGRIYVADGAGDEGRLQVFEP